MIVYPRWCVRRPSRDVWPSRRARPARRGRDRATSSRNITCTIRT